MHGHLHPGTRKSNPWLAAPVLALTLSLLGFSASCFPTHAQVFIVGREKPQGIPDFKPTSVYLEDKPLTAASRQGLITAFEAEQGFAKRPLPLGTPGLMLHANGDLKIGNGDYYDGMVRKGASAKTGERVAITDIRIKPKEIVFELNGGPERKHKYLRHVSIGTDPNYTNPVVQDDPVEPTGSRLTLVFDKYVPDLSADDLRGLIEPVIDFKTKSPIEAYTDTLPPKLKKAILDHQALVGMNRKMILYAIGAPEQKVREKDGQMPYEEWIYGSAPKPVQFVRFNGDRVIRIETASVGRTPTIRSQDETDGYLTPRPIRSVGGDTVASANGERGPSAAPTLRMPGEAAPAGPMQPVHNPTDPVKPSPLPSPPGQQLLP
jgi:hypothetical protein